MRYRTLLAVVIGWGFGIPLSAASAQTLLPSILERLDKLEERVKQLEAAPLKKAPSASTRYADSAAVATLQSQVAQLRQDLEGVEAKRAAQGEASGGNLANALSELRAQVDRLAADLEQVKGSASEVQQREEAKAGSVAELRGLVGEIQKQTTKLADSESGAGRLSGLAFGDCYYIGSSSGNPTGVAATNGKRQNALQLRRVYFQYDRKLEAGFATRLRFEMNDPGFGKTDKLVPFIKAAYLKYTHAQSGTNLSLGLLPTPTLENSEAVWGYRSVEKTILDLLVQTAKAKAAAADFGLSVQGRFDKASRFGYWAMVGNGAGQKPENDNRKKLYGAVQYRPGNGLLFEAYGDVESAPGSKDVSTLKGLIGYSAKKLRGGVEVLLQNQEQGPSPAVERRILGVSLFGSRQVGPRAWLFCRGDWVDPDNHGSDDQSYLAIVGADFQPGKDVHLMPNLYLVTYQAPGAKTDLIPRLTFFYTF